MACDATHVAIHTAGQADTVTLVDRAIARSSTSSLDTAEIGVTGYLRRTPLGDEFHGECGTAVEIFSDEGDDSLWGGIANYEAASLMSGGRGDDRLETIDPPGWIQDGVPGHDASSALRRNVELRGGGRVFVGHWEDVDDELDYRVDFHPASPPDWLSEELVVPDRD